MQIDTVTSAELQAESQVHSNHSSGYSFLVQPEVAWPAELKERLTQWGVWPHLRVIRARFDKTYSDLNAKAFMVDLVNSGVVPSGVFPPTPGSSVSTVEIKKLRCSFLNLNFLDKLEEFDIVTSKDYIKKTYGEPLHSIEITDKLREALLNPESDIYPVFDKETREELLYNLLELVVLGGSLNQYEDYLTPYRDTIKELYKHLVQVRKDSSTSQMYVDSFVYEVKAVEGVPTFEDPGYEGPHPQNRLYVIVQPFSRLVSVLHHRWVPFC